MVSRISHTLVFVADLPRAARFYSDALGLRAEPGDDADFLMLRGSDGAGLALHRVPPEVIGELTDPPQWREDVALKLCIEVRDLDALRDAVLRAGGQARAPWSWREVRFCECADLEGNVFQLFCGPRTGP
jgi:predicted enzyme related to lactoylglutathione lyase